MNLKLNLKILILLNFKQILFFLSFASLISVITLSCERDDICAESTATTPRLLVEFYDINNPDDLKSVSRLTVYGEGLLTQEPDSQVNETILFNQNSNAVELPLKIGTEGELITTRYILEKDTSLRLDDDTTTQSNRDIIEITYTPEFVYVSRACGYKSIFTNLDINLNPDSTDTNTWISNIQIEERTIENENTVYVHILH